MVVVEAAQNGLGGPLPSNLANLTTLLRLDLAYNGFNGLVPVDWPPMLRDLRLRGNLLGGPFPPVPATLRVLDIASNYFMGPLPDVPVDSVMEWVSSDWGAGLAGGWVSGGSSSKKELSSACRIVSLQLVFELMKNRPTATWSGWQTTSFT
jgi:hypothetical protein